MTADKSASAASLLTVNIMISVKEIPNSHIHIVTVLTMLITGTDNADTDELLTLKQVIVSPY